MNGPQGMLLYLLTLPRGYQAALDNPKYFLQRQLDIFQREMIIFSKPLPLLLQETGAMQETGANPRLFLPHKTTVLLVVSTCICLTYSFVIHDYS
jgi:hypothetical protein